MSNKFSLFLGVLITLLVESVYSQNNSPSSQFEDVTRLMIYSKALNEEREIYVYVPKGTEDQRYPVIYLLDGEMHRPYGEVLNFVRANPHIIIGINTRVNRDRDMIPCKVSYRGGSGGADKFLQFLSEELLPFVDASYNTSGNNILFGASNAGLFTIYAMLAKPESFFAYISSSATVGYCPELLEKMINEFNPKSRLDNRFLYITYGLKNEMPLVTKHLPGFEKKLAKKFVNLNIGFKAVKDEGHFPKDGFTSGFRFIYK